MPDNRGRVKYAIMLGFLSLILIFFYFLCVRKSPMNLQTISIILIYPILHCEQLTFQGFLLDYSVNANRSLPKNVRFIITIETEISEIISMHDIVICNRCFDAMVGSDYGQWTCRRTGIFWVVYMEELKIVLAESIIIIENVYSLPTWGNIRKQSQVSLFYVFAHFE